MWFECKNSNLLANPSNSFASFNGTSLAYFAGADIFKEKGCACSHMKTCPKGKCHCDAMPALKTKEGGRYTDKSVLPISKVTMAASNPDTTIKVNSLKCAPKPFGKEFLLILIKKFLAITLLIEHMIFKFR